MTTAWETRKLGDVCSFLNRGVSPKYVEDGGIVVLNQRCVRDHRVIFDLARRHDGAAKAVHGDKLLQAGDVLVNSTGTGTLGRVAQLRSTPPEPTTVDSHVTIVRPTPEVFVQAFFGYMLRDIEDQLKESGAGCGGQTELGRAVLADKFLVSFPKSISEQRRIVAILDEAFEGIATAKANAEKNLRHARRIFESHLARVFSQSGEGWVQKHLTDVARVFGRGKSKHRPRNDPKLYKGPYPFIQTGDISNADHWLTAYTQTYSELGLAQSHLWPKGTICIAIVGATVGETAILGFDACFPDSVIGIVVDDKLADMEYVEFLLQAFKAPLKEKGKGTARDNINLGTFENQKFPFPAPAIQRGIVATLNDIADETRRLAIIYERKLIAFEALKKSILHRAFSGELTAKKGAALAEAGA